MAKMPEIIVHVRVVSAFQDWLRLPPGGLFPPRTARGRQDPAPFDIVFVVRDGFIYIQPKPGR